METNQGKLHLAILEALVLQPGNDECADCHEEGTRWASCNLGVFMCIRCSGIHRSLGVHISKVKSVDMDVWKVEEMKTMQSLGNQASNAYWLANLPGNFQPPDYTNDSQVEIYIRQKYEQKLFAASDDPPSAEDIPVGWQKLPPSTSAETDEEPKVFYRHILTSAVSENPSEVEEEMAEANENEAEEENAGISSGFSALQASLMGTVPRTGVEQARAGGRRKTTLQTAASTASSEYHCLGDASLSSNQLVSALEQHRSGKKRSNSLVDYSQRALEGETQLRLDVKACIFSAGYYTELYFSLYSLERSEFITDHFLFTLTDKGMPLDVSHIGNIKCVFKDLTYRELMEGVVLVCRIFRLGDVTGEMVGKAAQEFSYRRPYGCSVWNLTEAIKNGEMVMGVEISPNHISIWCPKDESLFASLHQKLIVSTAGHTMPPRSMGLALGLTLFDGDHTSVCMKLDDIKNISTTVQKVFFSEVFSPDAIRNDLFVSLLCGEFSPLRKKTALSVEVALRVLDSTGAVIPDAVHCGCGPSSTSEFRSTVYYHENKPTWKETVRLCISPQKAAGALLYIGCSHAKTHKEKGELFSFAVLKLADDSGLLIPDGVRVLQCYKPIKPDKLPGLLRDPGFPDKMCISTKETVTLKLWLVSSKLIQNADLHSLLRMDVSADALKSNPNIAALLDRFTYIAPADIIRFFEDIFGVLLSMLEANVGDNIDFLICHALVFISKEIADDKAFRYVKARNLLEHYIQNTLSSVRAHSVLFRYVAHSLSEMDNTNDKQLRVLLKGLKYMVRMAVFSRRAEAHSQGLDTAVVPERRLEAFWTQYAHADGRVYYHNSATNETAWEAPMLEVPTAQEFSLGGEFNSALCDMVDHLCKFLERTDTLAMPAQVILFKTLTAVMLEVRRVLPPTQLANALVRLIRAQETANASLNMEKLRWVRELVASPLWDLSLRDIVLPAVIAVVNPHFSDSAAVAHLACEVVQELIAQSTKHDPTTAGGSTDTIPPESRELDATSPFFAAVWPLRQFLPTLVLYVQVLYKDGSPQVPKQDAAVCIHSLCHHIAVYAFAAFLEEMAAMDCLNFLRNLFEVLSLLVGSSSILSDLRNGIFPHAWIVMTMMQLKSSVRILMAVTKPMLTRFSGLTEDTHFQTGLFAQWFEVMFSILGLDELQLENMPLEVLPHVESRFGDLRATASASLLDMWRGVSGHHFRFVPGLVQPLLVLAMSEHEPTHLAVYEMYACLLDSEYTATGRLEGVEAESVDVLDRLILACACPPPAFDRFLNFLLSRFGGDSSLNTRCRAFIRDLEQLVRLVREVPRIPKEEAYEEDRSDVLISVLNYLRSTGKRDLYCRYVWILSEMHREFQNYVEAGMALLLAANMLSWSDSNVPPEGPWECESQAERKIHLLAQAADDLCEGGWWQEAIAVWEDLRTHYEYTSFDYLRVSEMAERQADVYLKLVSEDRFYAQFFRVLFYGSDFSDELRGREYVWKGRTLERLVDFVDRIKTRYEDATIVQKAEPVSQETMMTPGKFIQIACVKPSTIEEMEGSTRPDIPGMPKRLQSHVHNSRLRVFTYVRAFRKCSVKSDNEFKDLWTSITYVQTQDEFPFVARKSEVVARKEIEVSPLENALKSVSEKNTELARMVADARSGPRPIPARVMSSLAMVLNGVIDAAVNGGIYKYRDAFFGEDTHSEDEAAMVQALKLALLQQQTVVADGLVLHKEHCSADVVALQNKMEGFFEKMKADMAKSLQTASPENNEVAITAAPQQAIPV